MQNLRFTGTSEDSLSVAWDQPASSGSSHLTGYHVKHKRHSDSTWPVGSDVVTPGTATAHTVANLASDVDYDVRVQACNGHSRCGAWEGPIKARTVSCPTGYIYDFAAERCVGDPTDPDAPPETPVTPLPPSACEPTGRSTRSVGGQGHPYVHPDLAGGAWGVKSTTTWCYRHGLMSEIDMRVESTGGRDWISDLVYDTIWLSDVSIETERKSQTVHQDITRYTVHRDRYRWRAEQVCKVGNPGRKNPLGVDTCRYTKEPIMDLFPTPSPQSFRKWQDGSGDSGYGAHSSFSASASARSSRTTRAAASTPTPQSDAVQDFPERIITSKFDVHLGDGFLAYSKIKACTDTDISHKFFLKVFPVDVNDLPEAQRSNGYLNLNFTFTDHGERGDDKCAAARSLPSYAIREIVTGQQDSTTGQRLWEGRHAFHAFAVAEDAAVGTAVGTVTVTIGETGPVTYALTAGNDAGAFAIDTSTGAISVTGALDYETTPAYALTVTASDDQGGTATRVVTIAVTNVDEPPVFGAESYAFSVAENAAVTTQVGTVTASDPEGGTVVYDITAGNPGGVFVVDALAGTLVVGAALDYETLATYTLTVRAIVRSDSPAATTTVTVTVTDVVDAPPPPANLAATPAATSLALSWDAVTGATKYQVDYRVAEAETWTTAAADLTTTTGTVADLTCATAYEVRVRAYGSGDGYTNTWSAPSATLAATTSTCPPPAFGAETYAFSVAENSAAATAVGTITATTTGGGAVTYAITAGNDAGALAINASTGAITVAGALDHETTPSVNLTVEARAGGSQATTTVTVTVTDVDEAPVFGAADYAFSVAEDAAVDAAVGTVSATDPEDGTLTYAITAGNDAGAFAINTGTGTLTVAGALDYEMTDDYNLTVTASDAAGHTATADVAITVTDVAFPPVFGAASYASAWPKTARRRRRWAWSARPSRRAGP